MSLKIFLILLVALDFLTTIQSAKRRYTVELYNFTCSHSGGILKQLDCQHRQLAQNRYALDVNFLTDRQLSRNAEFRAVIDIKPLKSNKVLKFLDIKMNICDTLNIQSFAVPMAKEIFNEIMRSSNVPFACPIKGNFTYNVKNLKVTEALFPPYTLIIKYNFTLTFYENQKEFSRFLVQGATVPK